MKTCQISMLRKENYLKDVEYHAVLENSDKQTAYLQ